jgi:hypothetical protein
MEVSEKQIGERERERETFDIWDTQACQYIPGLRPVRKEVNTNQKQKLSNRQQKNKTKRLYSDKKIAS